jgi:hypothetical protein
MFSTVFKQQNGAQIPFEDMFLTKKQTNHQTEKIMKFISADHQSYEYMGRIGFERAECPLFIWPGSMVKVRFTGSFAAVKIQNEQLGAYSSFGILVDGVQQKIELSQNDEPEVFIVAQNLAAGENEIHELILFKRQAAANYFRFLGVYLDDEGELIKPESRYDLKLEVFGDSVSAGEMTEALYHEAHSDPMFSGALPYGYYDNAWFSYPLMTARMLNAAVHNNAQGGIALLDGTGYFNHNGSYIGMEQVFDKLSFAPFSSEGFTQWDFARYIPDYCIIAIGQNDDYPNPQAVADPHYREKWKEHYKHMLTVLDNHYNSNERNDGRHTRFILLLTLLMHNPLWDEVLDDVMREMSISVSRLVFKRCGKATPGHPRATEQAEMAVELARFIGRMEGR